MNSINFIIFHSAPLVILKFKNGGHRYFAVFENSNLKKKEILRKDHKNEMWTLTSVWWLIVKSVLYLITYWYSLQGCHVRGPNKRILLGFELHKNLLAMGDNQYCSSLGICTRSFEGMRPLWVPTLTHYVHKQTLVFNFYKLNI